MAFNSKDEGETSEWNEALFKMKRLHELQTDGNRSQMDLLAIHPMTNTWNYIMWFNSNKTLYREGRPKYTSDERKEVDAIIIAVQELLKLCPPHQARKSATYGSGDKKKYIFMKENWEIVERLLDLFDLKVKTYHDKHGLSTKNVEDKDGRSILR